MFKEFFKTPGESFDFKIEKKEQMLQEKDGTIDDVRKASIKVKSELPLPGNNGTIYEFFNAKDAKEANKILNGKLDGNTVFVKN